MTVIGITCGHSWEAPERFYVNEAYVQQIITAGAIPILIPYMDPEKLKVVVEQIDGLLIPGGMILMQDFLVRSRNQDLEVLIQSGIC